MVIKEVDVEVYGIAAFCDCGEMLEDSILKEGVIEHTCKKCGKKYVLDSEYPLIRYRFKK